MVTITLHAYDPAWVGRFRAVGAQLRAVVGDRAERIDHIGSTAVPGLMAKPTVDVQISVADLAVVDAVRDGLGQLGLSLEPDNPDRRKRFLRTADRSVHVHVRATGEFSQQAALLFRDYLRADADARRRYEDVKRDLAGRSWRERDDYADAKGEVVWALLREADRWAWDGWAPGPSDA